MECLQNIQSFETSIETGNLQSYEEQSTVSFQFITNIIPIKRMVRVMYHSIFPRKHGLNA